MRPRAWPAGPAGFHGKLPARADFIAGGLPPGVTARWDEWLQQALAASQARLGPGWAGRYRIAPPWRFALGAGGCGRLPLIGVLMPSMDAVGRCFPLLLARQIPDPAEPLALLAGSTAWFAAAEALALRALRPDFDPEALRGRLPGPVAAAIALPAAPARGATASPAPQRGAMAPAGWWLPLPELSAAPAALAALPGARPGAAPAGLWCSAGAPGLPPGLALSAGLIPPTAFAALLDGDWPGHGWSVLLPPPAGPAEWDRDA